MDDSLQRKINTVVYLPCAVAPLSLIGSALLLLTIYRTKSTATTRSSRGMRHADIQRGSDKGHDSLKTHQRLLITVSLFDAISSSGLALGPWPINKPGFCRFQGFMLTLGLASFSANCMLMMHFVLMIRFGMTRESMRKLEPWLHALPVVYALGVSVSGWVLELYNQTGPFGCWVAPHPYGCNRMPDLECTRGGPDGEVAAFFRDYFMIIPLIVWAFLSLFLLLVIVSTVVVRYEKSKRFVFQSRGSSNPLSNQRRQVIVQSILYGLMLTNSLVWRSMNTLFSWSDREYDFFGKHFWITVFGVTFFPLQGLWNFLIYIRPRYLSLRERCPDISRLDAIYQTVWNPVTSSSDCSSSCITQRNGSSNLATQSNHNSLTSGSLDSNSKPELGRDTSVSIDRNQSVEFDVESDSPVVRDGDAPQE